MTIRLIAKDDIISFKLHLENEEKSTATVSKYIHDVKFFAKWIGKRELTKSTVLEFKAHLIERYAPASVNSVLSSFLAAVATSIKRVSLAEIVVSADDWDQIFSASICDSEGNVISNTNHYSVAQYASKNITDDTNNKLSNVLRAMMKYIAD